MNEIDVTTGTKSIQEWAEYFVANREQDSTFEGAMLLTQHNLVMRTNAHTKAFHIFLERKLLKGLVRPYTMGEVLRAYSIVSGN